MPCDFKNKNLAIRVEQSSKRPNYLAITLLYQGGQTEIVGIDVAQVNYYSSIIHKFFSSSVELLVFVPIN